MSESDDEIVYVPVKQRKRLAQKNIEQLIKGSSKKSHFYDDSEKGSPSFKSDKKTGVATLNSEKTLLTTSRELQQKAEELRKDTSIDLELLQVVAEEKQALEQIQKTLNVPLIGVKERAQGIIYTEPIKTSWQPPPHYACLSPEQAQSMRTRHQITAYGNNIPPPYESFESMQFPTSIINALTSKSIFYPTQIQMQGIPIACMGRDLIGVAFTGSGKTLVFVIPMLMRVMESELKEPYQKGEGPMGLVICPSRELASQTYEAFKYYEEALTQSRLPKLKIVRLIGGTKFADQMMEIKQGVHIVVATPGRLNDILAKKGMSLVQCTFLVLDEADRLIDSNFEEDIRQVLDYFGQQKQTLLFSATMPRKVQEFARVALVDPIIVNIGRAGAANLNVEQQVEYVKENSKLLHLLDCLQKTPPPTMIFCRNKKAVDDVYEYLLLKNVEAVAIHAGMSQQDRQNAIQLFRKKKKDVLIGTDIVSKGLDFPDIQHVINFDMPKEIENYVHRIGRTGRCGKTGLATTFINRLQDESILLDLKALLVEGNQKIPPFLESLEVSGFQSRQIGGVSGCAYCGGLGHRIAQCPKLSSQKNKRSHTQSNYRSDQVNTYSSEW